MAQLISANPSLFVGIGFPRPGLRSEPSTPVRGRDVAKTLEHPRAAVARLIDNLTWVAARSRQRRIARRRRPSGPPASRPPQIPLAAKRCAPQSDFDFEPDLYHLRRGHAKIGCREIGVEMHCREEP